jgi:hypothetical protein
MRRYSKICGRQHGSLACATYRIRQYNNTKCLLWHHVGPEGKFRRSVREHLVGDGRHMVHQTQVCFWEDAPLRLRVDWQMVEGPDSCMTPLLDSCVYLGCPKEVRLLWRLWRFRGQQRSWTVLVVAADLVFCAIATALVSVMVAICLLGHTIAETFRHIGCASSCMFCIPFGTLCGCAWRGLHQVLPLKQKTSQSFLSPNTRQLGHRVIAC